MAVSLREGDRQPVNAATLGVEDEAAASSTTARVLSEALAEAMIKAAALSVLVCGMAWVIGCQNDAEPAAGGASAGGAGSSATAGGTTTGAGSGASAGGQAALAGSSAGGAGPSDRGGASTAGASSSAGAGATGELPPLVECANTPSVDRLTSWSATAEGTMVPASGSILVKEAAGYVGKVQFVGAGWHVVPVLIANQFDVTADLSKASGFTLTYSTTAELHVQLRSKSHWSGGDQYATTLPSTAGQQATHFFAFAEADWTSLFGAPGLSFADTLKEGMGLVFVGDGENTIVFYGLRIDGYTPPCQ